MLPWMRRKTSLDWASRVEGASWTAAIFNLFPTSIIMGNLKHSVGVTVLVGMRKMNKRYQLRL